MLPILTFFPNTILCYLEPRRQTEKILYEFARNHGCTDFVL